MIVNTAVKTVRLTAILVEYETPNIALASLHKFAPQVDHIVVRGRRGDTRRRRLLGDADGIILLDSDVCIASPRWVERLEAAVSAGAIWGGLKHEGFDISQIIDEVHPLVDERRPIVNANCLAMPRDLFESVSSFAAIVERGVEFLTLDTPAGAAVLAAAEGRPVIGLPFFRIGDGPLFPGVNCAEYFDPAVGRETLWSHVGRATSTQPRQMLAWHETRCAWIECARQVLDSHR